MYTAESLLELSEVQAGYGRFRDIHKLFEARVKCNPAAIALVFAREQITYQDLNIRANKLAHHLRSIGVNAEVLVGIYAQRSIETIVGLLAILKAGGAYVPIDPSYPLERLNFILEDTQLQVILAQDSLVDPLAVNTESRPQVTADRIRVVNLTDDRHYSTCSEDNLCYEEDHPAHLAYVMYTSGSTGKPKGVSILHRGVVRLVTNTNYVKLTNEEVFLQFAPIAFDASTFEIWGCLLNGGKLVIAPPQALSVEELGRVIQQYQITTLWLTAGLFHLMVDRNIDALKSLHQLLAGGDILSVPHVQKFLDRVKNCQLINGYGPTENTTFTCCYPIRSPLNPAASIPIGYPISNTQVYILDENLQVVADGVAGELYIGGDGLARGYFNQPQLTAEKFVFHTFDLALQIPSLPESLDPSTGNPFLGGEQQGERLYKTGDLARYLPNGSVEFLGRIDNQVKIRGFRIELGEIERVLAQHPQVRETIVLARQNATAEKQLVAYIVAEDRPITLAQLRNFLQQQLPDYMMPSAFVWLESLPLTPNGKVDRQKLPAPSRERPQLEQAYVTPQNEFQLLLTKIWREQLKLDRVGIEDNFFDLGGTSVSILKVAVDINQELGIEIPIVKLFQHSTIAGLAQYLQNDPNLNRSYCKIQSRAQQQKAAQARRRR
jgi:amino acid adenylation domain-containing protein